MAQIEIIKEMLKLLPDKAVSEAAFEGANIVLYTKDKEFFQDSNGAIRGLVQEFKKRVELRADPSITMDLEEAAYMTTKVFPDNSKIEVALYLGVGPGLETESNSDILNVWTGLNRSGPWASPAMRPKPTVRPPAPCNGTLGRSCTKDGQRKAPLSASGRHRKPSPARPSPPASKAC